MSLHEPATFLTDIFLALFTAWLAWRLRRGAAAENRAARWMSRTLALTAASGFIGGSYHGFAPNFSATVDVAWWRLTLFTINLLSAALAVSWMHEVVPAVRHRMAQAAIAAKFLAFALVAVRHPQFVAAIADYGSTLLAWLAAAAMLRRAWRGWMFAALALSALAAIVQQLRWAPAAWFNHNDLYHVIQAFALAAFYRAGRRFAPHDLAKPV